jgi:hypothetical protein
MVGVRRDLWQVVFKEILQWPMDEIHGKYLVCEEKQSMVDGRGLRKFTSMFGLPKEIYDRQCSVGKSIVQNATS